MCRYLCLHPRTPKRSEASCSPALSGGLIPSCGSRRFAGAEPCGLRAHISPAVSGEPVGVLKRRHGGILKKKVINTQCPLRSGHQMCSVRDCLLRVTPAWVLAHSSTTTFLWKQSLHLGRILHLRKSCKDGMERRPTPLTRALPADRTVSSSLHQRAGRPPDGRGARRSLGSALLGYHDLPSAPASVLDLAGVARHLHRVTSACLASSAQGGCLGLSLFFLTLTGRVLARLPVEFPPSATA